MIPADILDDGLAVTCGLMVAVFALGFVLWLVQEYRGWRRRRRRD